MAIISINGILTNTTISSSDLPSFNNLTLTGDLNVLGKTRLEASNTNPLVLVNSEAGSASSIKLVTFSQESDIDPVISGLIARTPNNFKILQIMPVTSGNGVDIGDHNVDVRLYAASQVKVSARTPLTNDLSDLRLQAKILRLNGNNSVNMFSNGNVFIDSGDSVELQSTNTLGLLSLSELSLDLGTMNRIKIDDTETRMLADYTRPLTLYGEPGVENGTVKILVFGGFGDALDSIQFSTANGNKMFDFRTRDTGGGDDGTHDVRMRISGMEAELQSNEPGPGNTPLTPLTINSQELKLSLDYEVKVNINEQRVKFTIPHQAVSMSGSEISALSPNQGWIVFNNTTDKLQCFDGNIWQDLF